jgi:hypothetical protein
VFVYQALAAVGQREQRVGHDASPVGVATLHVLVVSREVAAHKAHGGRMKLESNRHASFVPHHTKNSCALGRTGHVRYVINQLALDVQNQ